MLGFMSCGEMLTGVPPREANTKTAVLETAFGIQPKSRLWSWDQVLASLFNYSLGANTGRRKSIAYNILIVPICDLDPGCFLK